MAARRTAAGAPVNALIADAFYGQPWLVVGLRSRSGPLFPPQVQRGPLRFRAPGAPCRAAVWADMVPAVSTRL